MDKKTESVTAAELEKRIEFALSHQSETIAALRQQLTEALRMEAAMRVRMERMAVDVASPTVLDSLRADNAKKDAALRSIAANTCCDRCQEAALVARAALAQEAPDHG